MYFILEWFLYNRGKAFCFRTAINSTELTSTFETKPCYSRATVEPDGYGSSTMFETGSAHNVLFRCCFCTAFDRYGSCLGKRLCCSPGVVSSGQYEKT